jgi:DNA-binding beta-propeller fold protein YncE
MNGSRPTKVFLRAALACLALAALAGFGASGAAAEPAIWGSPGSGNGQFSDPWDVAVAPDGDVYVADRGNHRVQRFSSTGSYLGQWGAFGSDPGEFGDDLVAVAVSPAGKVFALQQIAQGTGGFRVQRFSSEGAIEAEWGTAGGTGLGQFGEPSDIAVGPNGRVYVVETGNRRVQSFDADGGSPLAWGAVGGAGEGAFNEPVAIAVDQSNGRVYVADAGGTARVQAFSATGEFITQWGSTGSADGQFSSHGLVGVAVGPEGDVYTREQQPLDQGGNRFQRFTPSGGFLGRCYWTASANPRGIAVEAGRFLAPDTGGGRLQVFDRVTPEVSLLAPSLPVASGRTAIFDATAGVPLGQIVRYEWDLNGDGAYELDTGTVPRATRVYNTPRSLTVGLRVTSDLGGTAVERRPLQIVTPSPPGPVGVTIDNGAQFTRDPQVTVTVRWPENATAVLIANDGSFLPSSPRPVAAQISWRLDSSGSERQPKTIYARFEGGASGPETYQDDIILDRTSPKILKATLAARRHGREGLRLKARDNASGIAFAQLTGPKGVGKWRRYSKTIKLHGPTAGLQVRVRDGAGNLSKWTRVRRVCRHCH